MRSPSAPKRERQGSDGAPPARRPGRRTPGHGPEGSRRPRRCRWRPPGQHAGTVPAPVAKAHLALAPQHAADGHQGLRAQIFSQYAPDHPAVPEQKRLPAAGGSDGAGQPRPSRGNPGWPEAHPLQQYGLLLRQGPLSKDGPLVEDGLRPGGGPLAEDGSVEGGPLLRPGAGEEHRPLDQAAASHPAVLLQHGMGADQGARLHRRPRAQPAGRDHGDTLWDGLGAPDAGDC